MHVHVVEPVGTHRDAVARRHRGDPSEFGDAAADERIRLQNLRRTFVQQLLEIPAPVADLARRNRRSDRARKACVQIDLVRAERLFDPVRFVALVTVHVSDRRGEVAPRIVRVEHQQHVVADRCARRRDALFLLGERQSPHFHLDGRKSSRDVRGELVTELARRFSFEVITAARIRGHLVVDDTAEIRVQRHAGRARIQVPDRRVEDAERSHHNPRAAVQQRVGIHLLPKSFDTQRFLADQFLGEELLHRDLRQTSPRAPHVAKADALLTAVGANLYKAIVTRADRSRRERGHDVERNAGDTDGHRFDSAHAILPAWSIEEYIGPGSNTLVNDPGGPSP